MNFFEFWKLIEMSYSEKNHLAIAVLGAPASGKSFTVQRIKKLADEHDSHFSGAMDTGKDLTVDKLRAEFQSKSPKDQVLGFYHAFNMMKEMSKSDPHNYEKWLHDIQKVWTKIDKISDHIQTSVDQNGDLTVNNASDPAGVEAAINQIPEEEFSKIVGSLDSYGDYKRVVRWVQQTHQSSAQQNGRSLVFDEAGDDPDKIVSNFMNLRKGSNPYITAAFMIHGPTPVTNLIQNAGRMVSGNDGGRDSSGAILQAWGDIQKGMPKYLASSEKKMTINNTESEIINVFKGLSSTTTKDNKSMKAIDLLVTINTQEPADAYKRTVDSVSKKFPNDPLATKFFNAILVYMSQYMGLDSNAKQAILGLVGSSVNASNLKQVFDEVVQSGKFNHPLNNLQKMYKQLGGQAQAQPQQPDQPQAQPQQPDQPQGQPQQPAQPQGQPQQPAQPQGQPQQPAQPQAQQPAPQQARKTQPQQRPALQAASVNYNDPLIKEWRTLSGLSDE
jgi:hypothetical protein